MFDPEHPENDKAPDGRCRDCEAALVQNPEKGLYCPYCKKMYEEDLER